MAKEEKEKAVVRLQEARLDDQGGDIVAHGWLDIEAMENLHVGDYQREVLESRFGKKSSILKAVESNQRLPDIMLGMRGQSFTSKGTNILLENDVFIIDGLQRVSAMRRFAGDNPDEAGRMRIGAEVRFGTTRDSERDLFTVLNVKRKAMSPSVIIRNTRNNSQGVATMYGLSMSDKNFAAYGKVCWDQQMHRGELWTALNFCKSAIAVHRHMSSGTRNLSAVALIPSTLDAIASNTGLANFRANVSTYFEMMDQVWGVRGIKYQDRATYTRGNFVVQLAAMLSDHEDFWEGNRLVVDAATKSKLKSFPIDDPTIIRLAGSGGNAGILLYRHLIDHMNKGRQASRHMTARRIKTYLGVKAKQNAAKDHAA